MARRHDRDKARAEYSGEVWIDGRGYATVALPRSVTAHAILEYEVRALAPGVTATIAAELIDGRFTIATDEPHVKVAWRVRARQPSRPRPRGTKEER